jgi:hypothetical protein
MKQPGYFDCYPFWIIFLSSLLSLFSYGIGAYIIYQFGFAWLIIFIIYLFSLEIRLLKTHCVDCYYYGKYCAFGKGKLSSLLFRKGKSKRFSCMPLTFKDLIPDLLVFLIPFVLGIVLLIKRFSIIILVLMLVLFLLNSLGNGFVRGKLACRYCRQRKLGCPAEKLFNKKVRK